MNTPAPPPSTHAARSTRRLGVLAWLRMARVFQKIDRRSADRFRERDLSTAQFDVLAHVGSSDGPTQQELADGLLVTKGNICQLLDRMERGDLLMRRSQGRANRLYLTPRGHDVYTSAVPEQEQFIDDMFSALSVDEQAQLLALLRKLDRSLDQCGSRRVSPRESDPTYRPTGSWLQPMDDASTCSE